MQQRDHHQQSNNPVLSIVRPISTNRTSTKEQRLASLMSIFKVAAELASNSISATESATTEVTSMIARLQLSKGGERNSANKGGDIIKNKASPVPFKEYISNPPIKQKQSQARKQPNAIGAPTTSSHKAAGNRAQRERTETERIKSAKALGML